MKRISWILYIVGSLVLIGLWFGPSYGRYARMKQEFQQLQEDIARLEQEKTTLMEKVRQIEEDPGMVEEIARRRYRMGEPGEIIYVVSTLQDKD